MNGFAIIPPADTGKWSSIAGQNNWEAKNNACYSPEEIEANGHLMAAAPLAPHRCDNAMCPGHRLLALLMSARDDVNGILGAEARILLGLVETP